MESFRFEDNQGMEHTVEAKDARAAWKSLKDWADLGNDDWRDAEWRLQNACCNKNSLLGGCDEAKRGWGSCPNKAYHEEPVKETTSNDGVTVVLTVRADEGAQVAGRTLATARTEFAAHLRRRGFLVVAMADGVHGVTTEEVSKLLVGVHSFRQLPTWRSAIVVDVAFTI